MSNYCNGTCPMYDAENGECCATDEPRVSVKPDAECFFDAYGRDNPFVPPKPTNALREKAEREKGCEWCKVGQDNARTVWIDGSFDAFTGDSYGEGASHKGIIDRKVAYCPMCGKAVGNEAIR